jgi:hypothetical protein
MSLNEADVLKWKLEDGEHVSEPAAMSIMKAVEAGYLVEYDATKGQVRFVSEGGSIMFCRSNYDLVRASKHP